MNGRRIMAIAVLLILIAGIVGLILHGDKANENSSGLQVVAAENFWGNIAEQLGGNYVHVTSIITDPNADPHLYESDARDAARVADASVLVVNGVGYDDFMNKLIGASTASGRITVSAQHVLDVAEGANPHLWYDIPQVNQVAAAITAAYISKDPTHKAQ